jgi:ferredoxin-NADP reductase
MPKNLVKLKKREAVANGTIAFHFDKPAGFEFKAGQFLELALLNPPETDAEGNARAFSIASAPAEPHLFVATRMRDTAFKRVFKTMPLGTEIEIDGPFGDLILHNRVERPAVLLAGGIGITPFRSIVFRAAQEKLAHRLFLFYSNHRPEDAPFLQELQALQAVNPNYKLIETMTAVEGRISKELLLRHLEKLEGPVYYVAGPQGLVSGMHELLNSAGVDDDDIRLEEFAGY